MKKVLSIIVVISLFLTTGMPVLASETENTFGLTDPPSENIEETEENEETQPLETQNTTETQEETVPTEVETLPENSSETQADTTAEEIEETTTSVETTTESTATEETTTTEESTEIIEEPIETEPIETEPVDTEPVKTEPTEPIETEPVAKKGPILRAPVRATVNYLTYSNGSYYYIDDMSDPNAVPTAHSSFPYRGEYVLGGDVTVDAQITPDVLTIDLNGFDLIDNYNNTKPFISVQQDDIFTLRDSVGTGRIYSNNLKNHTGVYLNNGGTFNFEGGTIEHFTTNENGGGINIWHKNDIVRMSGNATVKDCSTTNKSGGGGINVFRGKLYMSDNATVTGCRNTGQGAEKSGNGAGVHVGNGGTLYITDNVHIVNNSGNGYHGAGIDLWSDSFMYMSGSPVILNNINGKGYPCNLYIGSVVNIDGPLTGNPHDISITIQTDPVFTHNLTASNPGRHIEELLELFDADKFYWTDLPRHTEYTIVDHNGVEAKQAPVILVHFDQNHDNLGDWKVVEDVPGGYATNPGNPPARTGYNFKGWYRNANGTGSAFDFKNTNLPHEDFYLYAKWEIKTYTVTVTVTGETGHVTTSATATVNHGDSYTFTATTDDASYKIVSYKINNVEQLTENQTSITDVLSNITANKTITIVVEKQQIRTNVTIVENGNESGITVSPTNEQIVNPGDDVSYQFTLQDGYYVEEIFINFVGQPYTDTLLFEDIDEDKEIVITVNKMPQITFSYDGYVSQLDSSLQTQFVMPNTDLTGTISTLNGYHISELIIDGTPQSLYVECATYDISFLDITEDHVVSVKIAKNETVPAPTGVVLTVAPFVAVVVILGVCVVLVKRKRK